MIECLLQMHIAEESTKFGLSEAELIQLVKDDDFYSLKNVEIKGLMGMATFTEDQIQIRKEFGHLKQIFHNLREYLPHINTLSMGMSGDYQIGIEEGSTMVRIGSSIFGARNYG